MFDIPYDFIDFSFIILSGKPKLPTSTSFSIVSSILVPALMFSISLITITVLPLLLLILGSRRKAKMAAMKIHKPPTTILFCNILKFHRPSINKFDITSLNSSSSRLYILICGYSLRKILGSSLNKNTKELSIILFHCSFSK